MEKILNIEQERKIKLKERIKNTYNKIFESDKSAIRTLVVGISVVMAVYFFYILVFNNNFYNNWSDDSLQYYPFMCDFIESIKNGSFSLYSFKNYLGASFFSDTYYIPLDIFTFIIFILSFIMNTEIAMSIVEIVKMIAGVWAISKFLSMKGYSPKIIFIIGLFYFSSSGITCFSCFPCFTSLAFYLPFSLIIVELFMRNKWYYTPLYAFGLVLYNFYLAYTVFAFMAFVCLFMLIMNKRKFKDVVFETITFVIYVVLGLVMGMMIFYPSIKFVLSSTSREVAGGGSLKGMVYMLYGYMDLVITIIVSFVKCFVSIIKTKTGLLVNPLVFDKEFVQVRYLYHVIKDTRVYKDVTVVNSFFEIKEYYRMLQDTFTPLTPSSFYGYQSSYFLEHMSFYITGVGLLFSVYLWFLNDYKSKVYKMIMVFVVFMMLLPFFSYILSANLEVLYTRWFNVVTIPLLLIDAHVLNEEGLYNLKAKKLVPSAIILIYMGILAAYNHLYELSYFGSDAGWDENLLKFENKLFYVAVLGFFIFTLLMIGLYNVKKFKKKFVRILLYIFIPIVCVSLIGLIGYNILTDLLALPDEVFNTADIANEFFSVDEQMAFQYLIFVTLILIVIATYALLKKKKKMLIIICVIEFVFSGCMSFGSCVLFSGKEGTFERTHSMSDFCSEYIDEDGLYRLYVDKSCGDYLDTNTARLMPTGVNSEIFHSFINAETDGVAGLIFDKYDEGQAGKKALNTYSYFLNVFLGYKYVLCSTNSSFKNYNSNQFELLATDNDLELMLLEFKDYEDFLVYDDYISKDSFDSVKSSLKSISREKTMIESVVVDEEYIETLEKYFFVERDKDTIIDSTTSNSFAQKKNFASSNSEIVTIDEKKYYRYAFEGEDEITTRSYAINLYNLDAECETLVENNNIFIEFVNGEKQYLDSSNIRSMFGSTFHIPIYGGSNREDSTPRYLYIYANDDSRSYAKTQKYAAEAIFAPIEYFYNYENGDDIPDDVYLDAAIKITVDYEFDSGILNFDLMKYSSGSSVSYNEIYIEYEDGTIESTSNEMVLSNKTTIKNIYIVKSNDILDLSSAPTLKIIEYDNSNAYSDNILVKSVTTKRNKIIIDYVMKSTSDNYSIIMIPTSYSSEWTLIEGDVLEIIPVNGGFVGLIVSNMNRTNKIVLKFKPEGLNDGFMFSVVGMLVYFVLIATYIVNKKKRSLKKCQL